MILYLAENVEDIKIFIYNIANIDYLSFITGLLIHIIVILYLVENVHRIYLKINEIKHLYYNEGKGEFNSITI